MIVLEQEEHGRTPSLKREGNMNLDDIVQDIHVLEQDLQTFERKYGVLSETFYEAYIQGEEPDDDSRVRDWSAWAGAYEIWLRRREQYQAAMELAGCLGQEPASEYDFKLKIGGLYEAR